MDFVLTYTPWELEKKIRKNKNYEFFIPGNYKINKRKIKKTIDVITIGTMFKANRMDYVNFLKKNDVRIFDYGKGSANGFLSKDEYFKKINQSKISIRFSGRDIQKNIHPLRMDPLSKSIKYQTVGVNDYFSCGAFVLCERMNLYSEIKKNKHLVIFNSKYDLLRKIRYYLEHHKKREGIEKNCFKLYNENYKQNNLVKKISSKIYKRINKKKDLNKIYNINLNTKIAYLKIFNNFAFLNMNINYFNSKSVIKFFFRLLSFPYFSYKSVIIHLITQFRKSYNAKN